MRCALIVLPPANRGGCDPDAAGNVHLRQPLLFTEFADCWHDSLRGIGLLRPMKRGERDCMMSYRIILAMPARTSIPRFLVTHCLARHRLLHRPWLFSPSLEASLYPAQGRATRRWARRSR